MAGRSAPYNQIGRYARRCFREYGPGALAGLLAAAFYWILLGQGAGLADRDLYFHLQIAREILGQGIVTQLPAMAHAIHAERYVDYHFLFHYALVPFVAIFDGIGPGSWTPLGGILAGRAATAVFGGVAVFALDRLLSALRVRHRWFFLLCFVFASPIFTGRLLFGRAFVLFLSLLFLYLGAQLRRRGRTAGIIVAVAVWSYPGFAVLLAFAALLGVALFSQALTRGHSLRAAFGDVLRGNPVQDRRGRTRYGGLWWSYTGALFALLAHPAFPAQFYGYWLEFGQHSIAAGQVALISEWLPPPRELYLTGSLGPGVLLATVLLAGRRHDAAGVALLMASGALCVVAALSLKPFEYMLPFVLVYVARQSRGLLRPGTGRLLPFAGAVFASLLLALSLPHIATGMRLQLKLEHPGAGLRTAQWLGRNTAPGELIALPWDRFGLFYFAEPGRRYLFGLNPIYSYGANAGRHRAVRALFEGRGTPAELMASWEASGSRWLVLDSRQNQQALAALLAGVLPGTSLRFRSDRDAAVALAGSSVYFVFERADSAAPSTQKP